MRADHVRQVRLLAKLLRELLTTSDARACDSVGDVVDALKWRCARLHIRWTHDDVNEAMRLVSSNLTPSYARRPSPRETGRTTTVPAISRSDATAILDRLGIRL